MSGLIQITDNVGIDAAGCEVDAIARAFASRGGRSMVATSVGRCNAQGVRSITVGTPWERWMHRLLSRMIDARGLHSLRATDALIEEMVAMRPDVVQLHRLGSCYVQVPLLLEFLKRSRLPVVMTMHDLWMLTGHCSEPARAHCTMYLDGLCSKCPLKGGIIDCSRRNVRWKRVAMDCFDNLHIVAHSREDADVLHASWMGCHPIYVIPTVEVSAKSGNFATKISEMAQSYLELYDNIK